jgi:hypothetical protein
MRQIKASSSYLKNQTQTNLAKAALCVAIFCLVLFLIMYRAIWSLRIDLLTEIAIASLLVPAVAFYYYLRKYHLFNGGWEGEKQVAKLLSNSLSDDYYLLNDLYLRAGGGDIDHVVLAPSGVYVLETKNWSGGISCNGDEWQRAGKRDFNSSPSRQVKRNAAKIQRIIDTSPHLKGLGVWVEGVVVITNKHATLHLKSPKVPILKPAQLPTYITTHGNPRRFTREQLEAIGKEIAKQKA